MESQNHTHTYINGLIGGGIYFLNVFLYYLGSMAREEWKKMVQTCRTVKYLGQDLFFSFLRLQYLLLSMGVHYCLIKEIGELFVKHKNSAFSPFFNLGGLNVLLPQQKHLMSIKRTTD